MTIKHTAEELGGCEQTGLQSEQFPLPGVMQGGGRGQALLATG